MPHCDRTDTVAVTRRLIMIRSAKRRAQLTTRHARRVA